MPEILQTEQEANSRGTGNAEDHHRKNSGKKYGCHYRKNYLCDDLGVDSLDFFQILIDLEETFDVRIAPEEAEEIVTVGDAVETLRRVTKGRRNGK